MTHLDFRKSDPQPYRDMGGDHVAVYRGYCAMCGCRTYEPKDRDGDPRGMIGLRLAAELKAFNFGMAGPDVLFCYGCSSNDGTLAARAREIAKRNWATRATPTA